MFNDRKFTQIMPSKQLLKICKKLCELYLIERAPLEYDTIYTEAVPLKQGNRIGIFKAGINVFYPAAHSTLNHDRRVPGGILISINSVGHLANALVKNHLQPSLKTAVQYMYDTAMKSIGNGGIGSEKTTSTSWHNIEKNPTSLLKRCPVSHRPAYIPESYSGRMYSAFYHTDVLLPSDVMRRKIDRARTSAEVWPRLVIDYISEEKVAPDHVNYGLFHSDPIKKEALYENPWPAIKAENSPLFEY